ncbi:hypothetical protein JOC34_000243 [Virgibacillus halotolerans]|nr:hypothetical protein [Virgibacillus halotolerans]
MDTDVELDKSPSFIKGIVEGDIELFIPELTKL